MFHKKVKPSSVVIKISIHTNLHRKVVEKKIPYTNQPPKK